MGGPLDNYQLRSISVQELLTNPDHPFFIWHGGPDELRRQFEEAQQVVRCHPWFHGDLRDQPYVVYVPFHDRHCFLFKLDYNGTTFLMGDFSQPCLATAGDAPGPWEELEVEVTA